MPSITFIVFNVQITLSLVLMALATRWYLWPRLRALKLSDALVFPMLASSIRYMGLLFLVPTLTPAMPEEFAGPSAYGDLASGLLALVAMLANRMGHRLGVPLAWAYVVLGGGDLAFGFFQGFRYALWDHLVGAWTYIVFGAPLVIVALGTTVALLRQPARAGSNN
jgi:hypothetical protein